MRRRCGEQVEDFRNKATTRAQSEPHTPATGERDGEGNRNAGGPKPTAAMAAAARMRFGRGSTTSGKVGDYGDGTGSRRPPPWSPQRTTTEVHTPSPPFPASRSNRYLENRDAIGVLEGEVE